MKLWHIPDPWDYHKQGGYAVMADTPEDAKAKVLASIEAARLGSVRTYGQSKSNETLDAYCGGHYPKWDETEELTDGIYRDGGCDD